MPNNLLLAAYAALGGAVGSAARFGVGLRIPATPDAFPVGTLLVNATGSILIGLLATSLASKPEARALLIVGVCGGYTTFSAFSIETVRLLQAGRLASAFLYVGLSVVLCLSGTWLGLSLAR